MISSNYHVSQVGLHNYAVNKKFAKAINFWCAKLYNIQRILDLLALCLNPLHAYYCNWSTELVNVLLTHVSRWVCLQTTPPTRDKSGLCNYSARSQYCRHRRRQTQSQYQESGWRNQTEGQWEDHSPLLMEEKRIILQKTLMDSDIIVSMQLFESHHDNIILCAAGN